MSAEHIIKTALDGNFFYVNHDGKVRCRTVPFDHIPTHKPAILVLEDGPHHNAIFFSLEQDDIIVQMRARGCRWADVARTLKRCIHKTRERYTAICLERGMEPAPKQIARPTKLPRSVCEQALHMRELGMSYDEISKQMGLGKWQIADAVQRIRRSLRREAA